MAMTVEGQVSFSRVSTNPELGEVDLIAAAADINGDGRDDIVAGGRHEYFLAGAPDDRFTKAPLYILVGKEDGGFAYAPELVEGTIEAHNALVVVDDFNSDSRADLAVFDYGVYVDEESVGYGNPPQLWLSDNDGVLRPSEGLADAVRAEHALRPPAGKGLSAPADLHLKSVTSGDIDGDGDIDLWVDSIGGKNVSSHFMVNNGDGTFTVDEERAPTALRYNPPESWYHLEGILVDLDNDGDLDLSLGQNRDAHPSTRNEYSIVLLNDGTGHYPVTHRTAAAGVQRGLHVGRRADAPSTSTATGSRTSCSCTRGTTTLCPMCFRLRAATFRCWSTTVEHLSLTKLPLGWATKARQRQSMILMAIRCSMVLVTWGRMM